VGTRFTKSQTAQWELHGEILCTRTELTQLDAYALCSIAVSFRVTQVVDIVRGVHALIPKSLFAPELRRQIAVV